MEKLRTLLNGIEGKGYKAYKCLQGNYTFTDFQLSIDHVQGDPFAAPSRISVRMPMQSTQIPLSLWHHTENETIRRIALEDFLARTCKQSIRRYSKGQRGSGCSGLIDIESGGQEILRRNAVVITQHHIELRLVLCLPANGRRVAARQATAMFFEELPLIIHHTLSYQHLPQDALHTHINTCEDQHYLRAWLEQQNLVAFIADDSLLPRRSGIDNRPLTGNVIKFKTPASLQHNVSLPNCGVISGMGIPQGVTLIVGGGFHGKSTLLNALERGVYNHLPGDGRERVVTLDNAVKIRAEDGRAVNKVNISPFINRLPYDRDTTAFSTENASGSTSQAANIIEALHCGCQLLLIDEDTSATNFMIRDERMQQLVSADKEPITPLLYRIRELYERHNVSSIIVMGGSGDYFDIADTVIMLDAYYARDVTAQARRLARPLPLPDTQVQMPAFSLRCTRHPGKQLLNPARGKKPSKIDCKSTHLLHYGDSKIDLNAVEQLINVGQTRSIGLIMRQLFINSENQQLDLVSALQRVLTDIESRGLDSLSPYKIGNLALPRLYEIAATINRMRKCDWQVTQ